MRILTIYDTKITSEQLNLLHDQFAEFMQEHAEITPTFKVLPYDYSDYPTYTDSDGDERPTAEFLNSLKDEAQSRYRDTVDHVVVLVHEDNWKSDPPGPGNGIWGTNYSFVYGNYQLHYCRYDRDNFANSFGTFWHEICHSFDAFIKTYTGFDIRTLFPGMTSWDRDMTHGGCCGHEYIGRRSGRENTRSLTAIAPYLRDAYTERHKLADKEIALFISLIKQLVVLYRALLNAKNGVSKQTDNMSPKYSLTKANILPILKVLGWSMLSALIVTLIGVVEQTDFGAWTMLVPLVNTALYSAKEFVAEKQ